MNSSPSNPALPTWIFIVTDLAAIGAATAVAVWSPHPLPTSAIVWIAALVGIGAVAGLLPLVARYERQKNEALDERQSALEGLARTLHSSAEQISIAANGLHEIADLAHKNLRAAEQLPHKLQDKIAEFQSQLAAAADTEKEELERELLALRTSESERLESVSQRIVMSTAEWTKLEAATHQHLAAANDAVAKLAFGTASAIGKAQAAAEQALSQARIEAARALGESSGNATRSIESARVAALAEIEARVSAATTLFVQRIGTELNAIVARTLQTVAEQRSAAASAGATGAMATDNGVGAEENAAPSTEAAELSPITLPPKRPRKTRREDTAAAAASEEGQPTPGSTTSSPSTSASASNEAAPGQADEPLPVPANTIPEITPIAPPTAEPFSGHIATVPNGSASPVSSDTASTTAPAASATTESAKLPRKRVSRKEANDDPSLGLELDDSPAGFTSGATERVLTSDGATRLLVTAYIGIGNRLFIRGDGPGLSWERGVPLQFVSIGKWRWETNDASAPVQFKLYKNDELECATLGALSLDPGHQQEVTAAF